VTGNSLRKRFEPSAAQAKRGNNLVLTLTDSLPISWLRVAAVAEFVRLLARCYRARM
jgi:hypothetical protein